MSYPVRLEVTTLVGEPSNHGPQTPGPSPAPTLPPVASVTNTPVRRPMFVIGDSVNKRPKTAGVLGCSRVAPITQVNPHRPSSAHLASPNPHQCSSPHLSRRRHTRITPLPPPTQSRPPTDVSNESQGGEEDEGVSGPCPPLRLPKWKRERVRTGQENTLHVNSSQNNSGQGRSDPPWPTSSLDGGDANEDAHPAITTTSSLPSNNTTQVPGRKWTGKGKVSTIGIAAHTFPQHHKSSGSSHSDASDLTSSYVTERIHNLVSAFSDRANRVKARITQPPTPSTELSDGGEDGPRKGDEQHLRLESRGGDEDEDEGVSCGSCEGRELVGVGNKRLLFLHRLTRACLSPTTLPFPCAMEPQSRLYIWWLLVVSIMYTYNAWVIPLRSVFSHYQTPNNLSWWLAGDYLADLVYVLDLTFFKPRVMYLDNGFWVNNASLMRRHYWKTPKFKYDLVALLPLDLLYFKFGPISIFRLPRLIKIHTFWEFFNRLDSVLSSPHAVRVIRTVLYMLFIIHLNTCAYYGFSKIEGIGSNKWVFQGVGNAYVRCFYFATKTATSIGKNPKPENEAEYLFMTYSWLMGVFVFALLIGQIRDIVATATRNQNEYRRVMDHTQAYLHRLNLPSTLQNRVRRWFAYTWQNQKTLDEMRCLETLPRKMRTDIAINVHIQTLSKVQLFQDCDKALLRDLVLKLQPVLYLPGDYVCKKGEVGKEMYIVQSGQVLVMGGERGDVVLATLGEGSVFGEISLLALAGGNRRTADVRSRGFSSLFVLSKADLQATIKDYPEAQELLKNKAKRLIRQNEEREKQEPTPDENIIIKSRESTPKLLHAVLQVVRPDSFTANVIRRSSRSASLTKAPDLPHCLPDPTHSLPPGSRRPSLERSVSNGGLKPNRVVKTSLSESLPEEEEEAGQDKEKYVVVEGSEMEGGEDSHTPSPCSSSHSHPTSTTLHHASPQDSLLSLSHSNPSSASTTLPQSEDICKKDPGPVQVSSAGIRPVKSGEGNVNSSSANLVQNACNHNLSPPQLSHPTHNPRSRPSPSPVPPKHDRSRQPSGGAHKQASAEKQRGRNSGKLGAHPGTSVQVKSSQPGTSDEQSEKSRHVAANEYNQSQTQLPSESSAKSDVSKRSLKRPENILKNGTVVVGKSEGCHLDESACKESSRNIKDRYSSSTSRNINTRQPYSSSHQPESAKVIPVSQQQQSMNSNHTRASLQSRRLLYRNHKSTNNGSNKPNSGRHQRGMSSSNSSNSNTNVSTEDLLIQFGLSSVPQPACNTTTNPYLGPLNSPDSYNIFLTELSKNLPTSLDQVPSLSSPVPSLSLSSPYPSSPISPASYKVSCSAIVHRECSSSPDSSPFDAQESKL